jgi:hypothetical protein
MRKQPTFVVQAACYTWVVEEGAEWKHRHRSITVAPHDRSLSDTRERWLPLIQSLAQMRGWPIGGETLEQFVDAVTPFLAQPEVINVRIGINVIEHYYHDAPLVHLLLSDSPQAFATWNALSEQVAPSIRAARLAPDDLTALRRQVMATFRTALDTHTYQRRVAALLATIVREVEEEKFGHAAAGARSGSDA